VGRRALIATICAAVVVTAVAVRPSRGETNRTVPDVRRQSLNDAFAVLRGKNLCVAALPDRLSATASSVDLNGAVTSQRPVGGTELPPNGTVTLQVGAGSTGSPTGVPGHWRIPNVVGRSLADANGLLSRAHTSYVITKGLASLPASRADSLEDALLVTKQSPAPGTWLRQVRAMRARGLDERIMIPVVLQLRADRSLACSEREPGSP